MKTITVRLPESLVADIDAESRKRKVSKSDIVRERLQDGSRHSTKSALAAISDLVGSVEDLPPDLSANKKAYLKTGGYGRKRPR